ncbi:MAG: hypothetical protein E7087_03430 [Bacteroidales bacterium]|nr:hypothetical protein [Bacteroidales bacterium]
MTTEEINKNLRERVEAVAGEKIETPRDFNILAMRILDKNGTYISPITLKRFWGYLGKDKQKPPYKHTLNILAKYAGYINYDEFINEKENNIESNFLLNKCLQTRSLRKGCKLEIKWRPNRCVTVQYEGMEMFKVTESINSKLSKGDTFIVGEIVDGEPLILSHLIHEGKQPVNYICGRLGGIKFRELFQ